MEKLKDFLATDKGKLVGVIAGIVLLLAFVAAATPKSINLIINSGPDAVLSFKSAKRVHKNKRRKAKKDKK